MRVRISFLSFLFFLVTGTLNAQQGGQTQKPRYVVAPPESILLVLASQPDCALQISDARLLISADQQAPPLYQYQIKNRGTKPIRSYTVGAWASNGTGGTLSNGKTLNPLLMPGQVLPSEKESQFEIVPLTDELRERLKLRGAMKTVVVLIVEEIGYVDGTTYNAESTLKPLRDYFLNLDTESTP
jgi:hypothetical protein